MILSTTSSAARRGRWSRRRLQDGLVRCLSSSSSSHPYINGSMPFGTASASTDVADEDYTGDIDDNRMIGEVLDHSANLRTVRRGDVVEVPYELTITDTLHDFWFASFFDQSRIHSSRPFSRQMGFQDRVIPFSLALFLTTSMSHADAAKVQVGFGNVHYLWPLFSGDTVRKQFTVNNVRNTSDGNQSIIQFTCDLLNQRGKLCMTADKKLLFPFPTDQPTPEIFGQDRANEHFKNSDNNTNPPDNVHLFRDHILSKATTVLSELRSQSLAVLKPGQLILHSLHRALTISSCQQLASLARLTHERHFDVRKFEPQSEILIPGGLVLGLTQSATARDFHEVLHEQMIACSYVNPLHPNVDVVGAISYINHIDNNLPGDLQVVTVTTLGVKNVNVKQELANVPIPLELFQQPGMYAKDIEQICKQLCPQLKNKIVLQVQRKILRQTSHRETFLL